MSDLYEVKGSTLRSKFDFVELRFGRPARAALEERFHDSGVFPLLSSAWYPYTTYVNILRAIAEVHFDGNLQSLEQVGADSADKALSSLYQSFVREKGFLAFLEDIAKLHKMFYSEGTLEVSVQDDKMGCSIAHVQKPALDEADMWIASGFYQRTATLHGLRPLACRFDRDGDGRGVVFVLTWTAVETT